MDLLMSRNGLIRNECLSFLVAGVVTSLCLLLAASFISKVSGSILKVTGFKVPSVVLYGSDVDLDCTFTSPGRMKMYSVKWYQNSDEFYRYMFSDRVPVAAFDLPGIKVDVSTSWRTNRQKKNSRTIWKYFGCSFRFT